MHLGSLEISRFRSCDTVAGTIQCEVAKMALLKQRDAAMQCMSARDAKNSFGKLIDIARAEPVAIEKHGRAVVVVLSIESYEQLRSVRDMQPKAKRIGDPHSSGFRTTQTAANKTSKQAEKGR